MSKQQIISIILVILLILLVIGGYFVWLPKYQEFGNKKTELEGKDEEVKQRQEHLSELENISTKLLEYSSEVARINSALPTEPSAAAIFNFIQKASSENGLILLDTDIGGLYSLGAAAVEKVQKMPFSISVSGSYPSFKNFLSSLYKNSRFVDVKTISFSAPEKNLFTFDLELEVHSYNPKAILNSPEPVAPELE